ncbi:hypothetical protein J4E80_005731 [Alternaria sp. BMP 0032]|nr:hypothetical protein J4E80_005731 [Alternaria sp. BMP 0032]
MEPAGLLSRDVFFWKDLREWIATSRNGPAGQQHCSETKPVVITNNPSVTPFITPPFLQVVKSYLVEGTYFSALRFEGPGDPSAYGNIDEGGEMTGQSYLTATARRAIIFFEADNRDLGSVSFMGIGRTEVSTYDTTVKEVNA